MHIIDLINNYLQNKINKFWILFSVFLSFSIFYFFNLENYNFFSTDFHVRYKPNGLNLIDQILNLNFNQISLFNYYLVPELITGFFIKILPNNKIFSVGLNFLNIVLLFFKNCSANCFKHNITRKIKIENIIMKPNKPVSESSWM